MTSGLKAALLVLLGGLFATGGHAGQWQSLLAATAPAGERTVEFVETRHAFYLDEPLRARGEIRIHPPNRIVKQLRQPRPQRIVLESDRVRIEQQGDVRTLNLDEHIALNALYGVLRDIMLGQSQHIDRHFDVQLEHAPPQWKMMLKPRTEKLRGWIQRIVLTGRDARILEFKYVEPNGDYTVMEFHGDKAQ